VQTGREIGFELGPKARLGRFEVTTKLTETRIHVPAEQTHSAFDIAAQEFEIVFGREFVPHVVGKGRGKPLRLLVGEPPPSARRSAKRIVSMRK
jgi:hypothetical protein